MGNAMLSYTHYSQGQVLAPAPTRSRIGISIADPVLEHLDAIAGTLNKSRSRLIEELVILAMEQVALAEVGGSSPV